MDTSRRLWLEREVSDHTRPYPHNPYAEEFIWASDHIGRLMEERTIRARHYSRMTDAEVNALRRRGHHRQAENGNPMVSAGEELAFLDFTYWESARRRLHPEPKPAEFGSKPELNYNGLRIQRSAAS